MILYWKDINTTQLLKHLYQINIMANFDVKIKQPKRVEKKWGYELWIHNDNQYCGKLLVFTQSGNKFSMHYHMLKNETWYVQNGAFQFDWIVDDVICGRCCSDRI